MVTAKKRLKPTHVFNHMKDEYHLYLIINVYVSKKAGEWSLVVQKCLKYIFFDIWLPHPLLRHIIVTKYISNSFFSLTTSTFVVVSGHR